MNIVMVETKGYTLEEVSQAFDRSTTSLVDHRLYSGEQGSPEPGTKNRDLEDQK